MSTGLIRLREGEMIFFTSRLEIVENLVLIVLVIIS